MFIQLCHYFIRNQLDSFKSKELIYGLTFIILVFIMQLKTHNKINIIVKYNFLINIILIVITLITKVLALSY